MFVLPLGLDPGWHLGNLYTVALAVLGLCIVAAALTTASPARLPVPPSVLYVLVGAVIAAALALLDVTPLDPVRDHLLLERLCEIALPDEPPQDRLVDRALERPFGQNAGEVDQSARRAGYGQTALGAQVSWAEGRGVVEAQPRLAATVHRARDIHDVVCLPAHAPPGAR